MGHAAILPILSTDRWNTQLVPVDPSELSIAVCREQRSLNRDQCQLIRNRYLERANHVFSPFAVGQLVCLNNDYLPTTAATKTFRIYGTLPAIGGALQYHIRSDFERYELVTTEDLLVEANVQEDKNKVFHS